MCRCADLEKGYRCLLDFQIKFPNFCTLVAAHVVWESGLHNYAYEKYGGFQNLMTEDRTVEIAPRRNPKAMMLQLQQLAAHFSLAQSTFVVVYISGNLFVNLLPPTVTFITYPPPLASL